MGKGNSMKIQTNNYLMMFGVVLMVSLLFGKEASNPLPSSAKIMDALTTGPTQSVININTPSSNPIFQGSVTRALRKIIIFKARLFR